MGRHAQKVKIFLNHCTLMDSVHVRVHQHEIVYIFDIELFNLEQLDMIRLNNMIQKERESNRASTKNDTTSRGNSMSLL
jgi:hypothetical protein